MTGRPGTDTEVIVIGGGVMGAASAWALARRGIAVTVLEQFAAGHGLGASHGRARIFRLAYTDPLYIGCAQRALPLWRDLEDETGTSLLTLTGGVDHGDPSALSALAAALRTAGEHADLLPAASAEDRWPGLRFDGPVLFHPTAGRVDADGAVAALLSAAAQRGADVRHGVTVEQLDQVPGGAARVSTTSGRLSAAAVVVAAGGWTTGVLAGSPTVMLPALRLTQEQPVVFAPGDPAMAWPSFIHHPQTDHDPAIPAAGGVYGLGGVEGVKVGFHGVGPVVDPAHRARDAAVPDLAALAAVTAYARRWLPGVDVGTAHTQTCTYNSTVDTDFVVDRVGAVVVAAGFSGHGFKFAPAIGELVADLVQGTARTPERWSIGRPRIAG